MWGVLEKSAEYAAVYSSVCGHAWFICVFVFRLIVVATIGGSVYGDEQGAFVCSTEVIGCNNVCYDRFAKISHMRFWAFQLVALCSPVILLHFYVAIVNGTIEKRNYYDKKATDKQESAKHRWEVVKAHVRKRKPPVAVVKKQRRVYSSDGVREVNMTTGIQVAYVLSVAARALIEIIFLYLAYDMFRFASYPDSHSNGAVVSDGNRISSFIDLFWIEVPQLYRCSGPTVQWACGQHLLTGNDGSSGYVPCWVSRPWEKSIFLRYMNALSVVCLFLSLMELIQAGFNIMRKRKEAQIAVIAKREEDNRRQDQMVVIADGKQSAKSTDQTNRLVPTVDTDGRAQKTVAKRDTLPLVASSNHVKKLDWVSSRSCNNLGNALLRKSHPESTRSLNLPMKVIRHNFNPIYKLDSVSFDEDDDDDDDGGDSDDESDETEREDVSEPEEDDEYWAADV